ncbi:glycosyl hydrolase 53 [Eremomyces bilateralis CBS 781.70]|uniref:Arabinogalactan endo-beta-1,4-galactanase n=1 Tax=Eremomyces bilateralis CBS 781.70 TaxID=1392243 RepID=A0A6G1G3A4_9PEZI|nr:glycosyl hydrolase 53 [Eremomyces bilateralis CBS 781.70]KAF1812400.1 glycosyl hydrolase 53 [Eremomyces bilateralis CBS 781.70]
MRVLSFIVSLSILLGTHYVAAALTWKTFDISSVLVEESKGVTYLDFEGNQQPLESIAKNAGANSIKIRVWVNPSDGNYGLDYGIKLGKRATAAGLSVILNLHYSDTWADPGHQTKPAAWAKLNTGDLVTTLKGYTRDVANAFHDAGVDVTLISIGNEVRAGMLWPTGKYDQMKNLAKLLTSASEGVKDSKFGSRAKVMIHLDEGYSWSTQEWFYDGIIKAGFSMSNVDVQGVSYYPFWDPTDSTLENFKSTLNNMANKYGKTIVVSETDWPIKCSQGASRIPPSLRSIPFSADGQVQWMKKVAQVLEGVPRGLGKGLMYWEPGWIDNWSLGSPCEDGGTMFEVTWSGSAATARPRS